MNTTNKIVIGTAVATVATAAGTFFAGRSAWRGINAAKPVGLIVLAIVAYHTFDSYRASVDTAWEKVETVVERRAEADAAQKRAAELEAEAVEKTRAFNAQKAADMERAEKAYQAAVDAEARAKVKPVVKAAPKPRTVEQAKPQTVEQAKQQYDKATSVYNELCRYGCGGEPLRQWQKARDNYARAKLAAN